jgi:hypothetical protein
MKKRESNSHHSSGNQSPYHSAVTLRLHSLATVSPQFDDPWFRLRVTLQAPVQKAECSSNAKYLVESQTAMSQLAKHRKHKTGNAVPKQR